MIFITLLYFDLRVRKEGLDVRYLADNLPELDPFLGSNSGETVLDPGAATPPPLPPSGQIPRSELAQAARGDSQ